MGSGCPTVSTSAATTCVPAGYCMNGVCTAHGTTGGVGTIPMGSSCPMTGDLTIAVNKCVPAGYCNNGICTAHGTTGSVGTIPIGSGCPNPPGATPATQCVPAGYCNNGICVVHGTS